MTLEDLKTLVPGQKIKIVDSLDPSGADENGVGYNFNTLGMSKYLGRVVTFIERVPKDIKHIIIEEDAGEGGTVHDKQGRDHWIWKYNVLELLTEEDVEPDEMASDGDLMNVLFA